MPLLIESQSEVDKEIEAERDEALMCICDMKNQKRICLDILAKKYW